MRKRNGQFLIRRESVVAQADDSGLTDTLQRRLCRKGHVVFRLDVVSSNDDGIIRHFQDRPGYTRIYRAS